MRTDSPRVSSNAPSEPAVRPLPKDETTPPVTKIYFTGFTVSVGPSRDTRKSLAVTAFIAPTPEKLLCQFTRLPGFCRTVQAKPQLLVWLTCDGVHIDPATGKHTILGVFSNIKGRSFPLTHPYMVWFMTLTDVQPGKHRVKISMGLDPTRLSELIHREFESGSPLHRINLINELSNLTFSQPGDYSILIEVDEEPILATSMTVTL